MKKTQKQEKGITLMALVVTIIILLILAAVTVRLALDDNGVISEAKGAINEWDKASSTEESQVSKLASDMKKLRNRTTGSESSGGNTGEGGEESGGDIDKVITEITGNETENTKTRDNNGNKIVIPAGFKVVNPEDDVTKGIIIEDESAGDSTSKGNQYVWIPVSHVNGEKTNTIKDSEGIEHTIELARYTFDVGILDSSTKTYNGTGEILTKTTDGSALLDASISTSSTYSFFEETASEHSLSKYRNTIAKDINEFKDCVKNNGGYYLARYEAGDPTASSNRTTSSSQTTIPVFKSGKIVYNWILQPNSATLMRNLYSNQKENYESDLINSYSWDTAIVFIQEFSEDKEYSKRNAIQTIRSRTGQATNGSDKDIRCNIYDMSSNIVEWTTESINVSSSTLVYRGGGYNYNKYYSSYRNILTTSGGSTEKFENVGLRRYYIY